MVKLCICCTAATSLCRLHGRAIASCCTLEQWIGRQLCTSTTILLARIEAGMPLGCLHQPLLCSIFWQATCKFFNCMCA